MTVLSALSRILASPSAIRQSALSSSAMASRQLQSPSRPCPGGVYPHPSGCADSYGLLYDRGVEWATAGARIPPSTLPPPPWLRKRGYGHHRLAQGVQDAAQVRVVSSWARGRGKRRMPAQR